MAWVRETGQGIEIDIKAVPGASRDRVVGLLGECLKVQISAAPEKGKANKAIESLLANSLGVRARDVAVVSGHTTARKTVRVTNVTIETCRRLLEKTDAS